MRGSGKHGMIEEKRPEQVQMFFSRDYRRHSFLGLAQIINFDIEVR